MAVAAAARGLPLTAPRTGGSAISSGLSSSASSVGSPTPCGENLSKRAAVAVPAVLLGSRAAITVAAAAEVVVETVGMIRHHHTREAVAAAMALGTRARVEGHGAEDRGQPVIQVEVIGRAISSAVRLVLRQDTMRGAEEETTTITMEDTREAAEGMEVPGAAETQARRGQVPLGRAADPRLATRGTRAQDLDQPVGVDQRHVFLQNFQSASQGRLCHDISPRHFTDLISREAHRWKECCRIIL